MECQAALDANYLGAQDTPPIEPGALDVLCQHILGMIAPAAIRIGLRRLDRAPTIDPDPSPPGAGDPPDIVPASAAAGFAARRAAAMKSDLPESAPELRASPGDAAADPVPFLSARTRAMQINRFCASGLDAINFGAAKIAQGADDIVVTGGVESMSRVGMAFSI